MNQIILYKQLVRIIFFLFLFFISLVFETFAQGADGLISMQQDSISLKDAFTQIEKQTKYSIAYEQSGLDLNQTVTVSFKNVTIEKAIQSILRNTAYSYKINGYHIIITTSPQLVKTAEPGSVGKRELTQTIRGIVKDAASGTGLSYVAIAVSDMPGTGTMTNDKGEFVLTHIPVGRHTVVASFVGYSSNILNEVLVNASRETFLEIPLNENIHELDEVVVHPQVKKEETLNPMAITGGRMISMEEASRFANGFDDPARLSTAFAGVAGDISSNAVAIRGNAPQFTQWRMEGVEIPIPTHYSDLFGLGGGFLSALSTQIVGNSDFYNGAFPAEYNNALSGVFDIQMRTGSNRKYQHAFQIGILGVDFSSEGPISKKRGSSYLINTRLSTTSFATGGEANLKYQDLAFKLNFPTKKAGTFSVWMLRLKDRNETEREDPAGWETVADRQTINIRQEKLSGGLTHKYYMDNNTYIRSSLSLIYSRDHIIQDQLTFTEQKLIDAAMLQNRKWDIVASSYLNKKFSSKHINRTGITFTNLIYDLDYKASPYPGLDMPMEPVAKGDGNNRVVSAFSSSVINFNEYLKAGIGVTAQYFDLNNKWTVEPRAALKWSPLAYHSFSVAYGLHSRREKLDYYYVQQEIDGKIATNKNLDFSKAHHFSAGYDWSINQLLHLKIEPYFQYLFHIPVERNSSFSIINYESFYLDRILENKGAGKNYGIDVTLEQYMKNGFYYMFTGSLFKTKYRGGDNIWRDTRFDKGYMFNILTGKEWMVGKNKQNMFGVNVRIFFQGGNRYTPVDEEKSREEHLIVEDETRAYSEKFNPLLNGDISLNYKINKRKVSHEFSLKLLNVGTHTGAHYYLYNEKTLQIEKEKGIGIFPNISYKIYF